MQFLIAIILLVMGGCGSPPYSHSTPAQQADTSVREFGITLNRCLDSRVATQVAKGAVKLCDCPKGGSISYDEGESELDVSNCTSSNGRVYGGTMTIDWDDELVSINMPQFGECEVATGSGIGVDPDDGCQGTVYTTCSGLAAQCTFVDPAAGSENCDINCTWSK